MCSARGKSAKIGRTNQPSCQHNEVAIHFTIYDRIIIARLQTSLNIEFLESLSMSITMPTLKQVS